MAALAFKDVPALGRLIAVSLQAGRGLREIMRRIQLARDGLYSVKSYSQNDMDIASMFLIFGGPKLVFAMSKSLKLPSLRTIQSKSNRPRIFPSIGCPTENEIDTNINCLFGLEAGPPR
jgi:hypothetical protein